MNDFLPAGAWRGWRRADFPAASWQVEEDGALRAVAGAGRVDLVTRDEFGDFDLHLEWRVAPGGNSGILYRVSEEPEQSWESGPEMQLLDDERHPDGRTPETRAGALYGLRAPAATIRLAAGSYHTARVLVRGNHVEHWLGGSRVVVYDLGAPALHADVARSKFGECPRWGREPHGRIVLQHHGDDAWFRRIRIERLADVPFTLERPS